MKILLTLLVMVSTANASPYPVVAHIQSIKKSEKDWEYRFTWAVIDVGNKGDIPISTVCPVLDQCLAHLGHKHFDREGAPAIFRKTYPRIYLSDIPNLSKNTTLSEAAMFAYNSGLPDLVVHSGADPVKTGECIGVAIGPQNYFSDTTHWDLLLTPPVCERIPPTPTICKTETPSLTFEHEITLGSSSTITKEINISCTDPATALIAVNEPTNEISRGINSTISVNGAAGSAQVNMNSGLNVIPVSNTVNTSNASISPGEYHWSTYLTIEYN